MRIGRFLAGAGALSAIGVLVAPGLASAHTAVANPSCTGLSVEVSLYPDEVETTITIDSTSTVYTGNRSWDIAWDQTKDHTWSVKVRSPDGFPFDDGGTQKACVEPATTTTAPPPPTTQPPPPTTQPATTTTEPGATTTTSTTPAGGATTTTGSGSGGSGTSTSGHSGASSGSSALPATGYATGTIAAIAGALLISGAAMWYVARRRAT